MVKDRQMHSNDKGVERPKGVALGAGIGMIVGSVLVNPGVGMVIGAALGLIFGPALARKFQ